MQYEFMNKQDNAAARRRRRIKRRINEGLVVLGIFILCILTVWLLFQIGAYVAVIGDAAKVSNITNAVYWGYHAALDI